VKAAEVMLRAVEPLTGRDLVIFMMSGGGSALVEKPIDDSISLEDLIATYRALVHSGAPIAQINTVRKHLSAIKGGRLALAASPAHQLSIMVSDVPENALDSLASGPTIADTSTVDQCYALVDKYKLLPQFPASVRKLFESRAILETPKSTDAVFSRSRWSTLASNAVVERSRWKRRRCPASRSRSTTVAMTGTMLRQPIICLSACESCERASRASA